MKPIFVCVVRRCENHVLLVHHKDRKGWEFPGGKLDSLDLVDCSNFENLQVFDIFRTALREYSEETDPDYGELKHLSDTPISGMYYNANVGTLFLVYQCRYHISEKVIHGDQSIDFIREFDLGDLPELSFPTDNAVILDILKKK